jgi:hypothetical protein
MNNVLLHRYASLLANFSNVLIASEFRQLTVVINIDVQVFLKTFVFTHLGKFQRM